MAGRSEEGLSTAEYAVGVLGVCALASLVLAFRIPQMMLHLLRGLMERIASWPPELWIA